MHIVLLHSADAAASPRDPVLDQLSGALEAAGHEVSPLTVESSVQPLVSALTTAAPDLVFNLAESFGGKSALESNVAALLNLLGLRYTGSSPAGLLLAGDKAISKKILSFHSVRTPPFATMYRGAVDWAGDISFPVIVKPPQEDASLGVSAKSVVHDIRELLERMDAMQTEFQQPVLVEQYIEGREFYVGVLGNVNARALPVMELAFRNFPADRPRIASWEAKWGEGGTGRGAEYAGTESIFPDDLEPSFAERMQAIAVEAFQALRLRDYGRVDLRVSAEGEIYVIEVNPNCYLERESEFARAAQRAGIDYDSLAKEIVERAAARYSR